MKKNAKNNIESILSAHMNARGTSVFKMFKIHMQ